MTENIKPELQEPTEVLPVPSTFTCGGCELELEYIYDGSKWVHIGDGSLMCEDAEAIVTDLPVIDAGPH